MKKSLYLTAIVALLVAITGCRSSASGGHHHTNPPELLEFNMVDSYLVNSGTDPFTQLALSPYIDGGLFEVYWDVYNEDDYVVELSVNDVPDLSGRRVIKREVCGPGLDCDLEGEFYCEYYEDFSMTCDLPSEPNPGERVVYFDDLIQFVPQTLYFILDICDTNSDLCEYQILDVVME